MIFTRIFVVFLLLTTTACGTFTTVRHSSDYAKILKENGEITVLPPEVIVNTSDIAGKSERMYDYEYHMESVIQEILIPAIKEKGYKLKPLSKKEIKEKKLYQDSHKLRENYSKEIGKLYAFQIAQKVEIAHNINATVKDSGKSLAEKTGQDLVMLIDYNETVKTNGARLRDFAIDVLVQSFHGSSNQSGNAEDATLKICILDAKTGKILWTNIAVDVQNYIGSGIDSLGTETAEQKKVSRLVKNLIAPLPEKSALLLPPKDKEETASLAIEN